MTGFESAFSSADRDFEMAIDGDQATITSMRRAADAGFNGEGWVQVAQRFARTDGVWRKLGETVDPLEDAGSLTYAVH